MLGECEGEGQPTLGQRGAKKYKTKPIRCRVKAAGSSNRPFDRNIYDGFGHLCDRFR